jgi:hypothetical protein
MTYQQAQEALVNGLLVKRAKWPNSTWVSSAKGNLLPRLRTRKPFDCEGEYTIYKPTQEDRDATDWRCRPS